MTVSRSLRGRYRVIVIGLSVQILGVAALGWFLAVAGHGLTIHSVSLGIAALILLIGGAAVVRMSPRRTHEDPPPDEDLGPAVTEGQDVVAPQQMSQHPSR